MKEPKEFYKHISRKDLEPTDKQVKKFKRAYNRPDRMSIMYFYAGILITLIIGQLIRLL